MQMYGTIGEILLSRLIRFCNADDQVLPLQTIQKIFPWHDTNCHATVQKLSCHENQIWASHPSYPICKIFVPRRPDFF